MCIYFISMLCMMHQVFNDESSLQSSKSEYFQNRSQVV